MNSERTRMLSEIKRLIAEKHVNVDSGTYAEWTTLLDQATPNLLLAPSIDFHAAVHSSLSNLHTSHTAFLKPDSESIPLRNALCATLHQERVNSVERWIFQDVIEDGPAYIAGIRPGHVLLRKDGVEVIPPDTPSFGFGGSYLLTTGTVKGNEHRSTTVSVPNKPAKDRPPMIEPKALSYRVHPSGVPMITVSTFPGAVGLPFVRELDDIIKTISREGRDRLIIDLRGNIGGGLASLRLMSYLCPDRRPIGYTLTKRHFQSQTDPKLLPKISSLPSSKPSQLAMFFRFRYLHKDRSLVLETEGLGSKPFHGRIVILINEHTHSAAEMVAAFAKENRLASLVGATTAGEVMGGANFSVGDGYSLRIPITTWQTWKGAAIEGRGVTPDVAVNFLPAFVSKGQDHQLEKAIDLALHF